MEIARIMKIWAITGTLLKFLEVFVRIVKYRAIMRELSILNLKEMIARISILSREKKLLYYAPLF